MSGEIMRANFFERLNRLRQDLKCPKSHYNAFGGYHHRSLEDIFNAIKQLTSKYSITIDVTDKLITVSPTDYFIEATARAYCSDTGTQCSESVGYAKLDFSRKKVDASQITGMASSYARKYALSGLLHLDDIKDADTIEGEPQTTNSMLSEPQTQVAKPEVNTEVKPETKPEVKPETKPGVKPVSLKRTKTDVVIKYSDGSIETASLADIEKSTALINKWMELKKS